MCKEELAHYRPNHHTFKFKFLPQIFKFKFKLAPHLDHHRSTQIHWNAASLLYIYMEREVTLPLHITDHHRSVTFRVCHTKWHKFKQQHSKSSSCSSSQIMQPPTVHRPCNASFTGRHCISSQTNPQTFKVKKPKSTTCQNASTLKRQTTSLGAAAGNPNTTLPCW